MRIVPLAVADYHAEHVMSPRPDPPALLRSDAEVPVTLLLGAGWRRVGRSVRALTRRLAGRLGHAVEACDLEAPGAPFAASVGAAVERGTARLVLLPVTLNGERAWSARLDEAVATARRAWPFLHLHRGMPPAIDD